MTDQPSICPKCGIILPPNTNFCPNCGFQTTEAPQVISIGRQVWIYFVSLLLPPLGFIWVFKYFRSQEPQKKRVAYIATILTIISIIISVWYTVGFFQSYQQQIQQINNFQNIGG